MSRIPEYVKAIVAALIAGLGSAQQSLDDGSITTQEWVGIAVAALLGLGIVAAVPNRDKPAGEGGYTLIQLLLAVALFLVIVFLGTLLFDVDFRG